MCIQRLVDYLDGRQLNLENLAELKHARLLQCVQLCYLKTEVTQLIAWMNNNDSMITAGIICPSSHHDAEDLAKEESHIHDVMNVSMNLFLISLLMALIQSFLNQKH